MATNRLFSVPEPGAKIEINVGYIENVTSSTNFRNGLPEVTLTFTDVNNEFMTALYKAVEDRNKKDIVKNYKKTLIS